MANSTTHLDLIEQSQAQKEVTANAMSDAASPATVYGRRASTTTGLTWGYYGGNIVTSDDLTVQVSNSTVGLSASSTVYVVAAKSTGAVTTSTLTTSWNDTANYWRLYSIVTGTATVTSYTDYRQVGRMTGVGTGLVAPVTKTASFTFGANENEVICNGTGTITATLPTASAWVGRKIRIKTVAAFAVSSASSDVVPLAGGSASTGVVAATAGKWAELVSDGSNWVIMAAN